MTTSALVRREGFDAFGALTSYLYHAMLAVQSAQGGAASGALRLPGAGELAAYTTTSSTVVPLHDLLGSTIATVNASGAIAGQFTYDPFGNFTQTGGSYFFFLFAGMEYDPFSGLYRTPARYYSPTLQRFLSEDPLQFAGGDMNLLAYAANDPIDMADPTGMQYCAYGGTGSVGAIPAMDAAALSDLPVGAAALVATVQGSVSIGASGAPGGAGGHAAMALSLSPSTFGEVGMSQGQIILAQSDPEITFEPDFYYYPDEEPSTPEAWGPWKIAQNESEAIVRRFLNDALMMRTGKTTQYRKSGGFVQANTDFDRITSDWSLAVRNQATEYVRQLCLMALRLQ